MQSVVSKLPTLQDFFYDGLSRAHMSRQRYRTAPLGIEYVFGRLSEEISNENMMKAIEMLMGTLWQKAIGSYGGFIDLGQGPFF